MNLLSRFKRLVREDGGNAMMIFAAGFPMVIGSAAVAVDTIQMSVARRQLQRSADSAALAGVYALSQNQTTNRTVDVNRAVNRDLELNNDLPLASTTIQNAPASGAYAGNTQAVRVVLATNRAIPFFQFFTGGSKTIQVEATAARLYSGQYCLVSLENTAVTGVNFTGSSTVNLGCGVVSNSPSTTAVVAGGSTVVVANPVAAVGGVPPSGGYTSGTVLMPYTLPQSDPYAGLPTPSVPSPCSPSLDVLPNRTTTIAANGTGVYCFQGMDIKGTLNLAPGVYYIDGHSLSFGAQAQVTGAGVTFILTSSTAATSPSTIAQLNMHAGAVLDISAPTSGTYSGVLMYQDRRAEFGTTTINGNSYTRYEGGFYFPAREVTFNGNSGLQTQCVQLVARRLNFSGNTTIQNSCPTGGGARAFDFMTIRLVA